METNSDATFTDSGECLYQNLAELQEVPEAGLGLGMAFSPWSFFGFTLKNVLL